MGLRDEIDQFLTPERRAQQRRSWQSRPTTTGRLIYVTPVSHRVTIMPSA